jgi:hypothetical protein
MANGMSDAYSKLRSNQKKLENLNNSEADAISSVRARFAEKRRQLEEERAALLKEVVPS